MKIIYFLIITIFLLVGTVETEETKRTKKNIVKDKSKVSVEDLWLADKPNTKFSTPSAQKLQSVFPPYKKIDRKLEKWAKRQNIKNKAEIYYILSLYLRYVLRDEIKIPNISSKELKKLKDKWADKALRWAKKAVENGQKKNFYPYFLSNLASLYAIKITYSVFPFLLYYVNKFQEFGNLPIEKLPNSFELRTERLLNYSGSSYKFYPDGKNILDEDLAWLENRYQEIMELNLDEDLNARYLDLLERATIAAATYYYKEVENRDVAIKILKRVTSVDRLKKKNLLLSNWEDDTSK